MMKHNFNTLISLISKNIGISSYSIGEDFFKNTCENYIKNINIESISEEKIIEDLFELIKVPETWFLRQKESFDTFEKEFVKLSATKKHIRILSLPCSTGEEPYSIAMQLSKIGILPSQYTLVACDLSEENLEKAKAGVYSKNSFRSELPEAYKRFFIELNDSKKVVPEIASIPKFSRVNILNLNPEDFTEKFDFIFCRNLLIYFTEPARYETSNIIKNLLCENGLVFTGYSEYTFFLKNGFKIEDGKLSFACSVKKEDSYHDITKEIRTSSISKIAFQPQATEIKKEVILNDFSAVKSKVEQMEFLANSNNLNKACEIALEILNDDKSRPDELVLSSSIFSACEMNRESVICLTQALYLDPNNEDALILLVMYYQQIGHTTEANKLKYRLKKLYKSKGTF